MPEEQVAGARQTLHLVDQSTERHDALRMLDLARTLHPAASAVAAWRR
ncbi:hypothetical protein V7793_09795 [Streptomyces sp. KLMMK]